MLRVLGRRLGGRVGKSGGSSILQSGSAARAAFEGAEGAKAGKNAFVTVNKSSTNPYEVTSLVDVVLPRVDCSVLKHVLSSSSSSSTLTDIPDIARVLRLDYTGNQTQEREIKSTKTEDGAEAAATAMPHPLADILLVNRIHAAVIEDTKQCALMGEAGADAATATTTPPPLLVLVETSLSQEDAEVQQFIIRNALSMYPLPAVVEVSPTSTKKESSSASPLRVTPPPLTVLVLSAELTARVRALAELPPLPKKRKVVAEVLASDKLAPAEIPSVAQEPKPKSTETPETGAKETNEAPVDVPQAAETPILLHPPPEPIDPAPAVVSPETTTKKKDTGHIKTAARSSSRRKGSQYQQRQKRRADAFLRQDAAAKQKKLGGCRGRITHKHTPRRRSSVKAAAITKEFALRGVALPPRLLSVDDTTEKLLWVSEPGHPLSLSVLAPLINPSVFEKMCAAAAAAPSRIAHNNRNANISSETKSLYLHTVVYRAGAQSSALTMWLGAAQAAADLAEALSHGKSQLPAAVAELAAQSHTSFTVDAPCRSTSAASVLKKYSSVGKNQQNNKRGRGADKYGPSSTGPQAATSTSAKTEEETPYIYLLIHTSLSPQDAEVLQCELDYQYVQLKSTPAGAEIAGIAVLTTQDVSPAQLWYVLESGTTSCSNMISSSSGGDSAAAPALTDGGIARSHRSFSAEGAAVARTFQDVYRVLTEQPELLPAPLLTPIAGELKLNDGSGIEGVRADNALRIAVGPRHPDALVAEALRIAALAQLLVQKREAELREEFATSQRRNAVSADSEAVARAAQKVEIKTMVTEAVEEVSVRHEQATAHLVKTLSSMVGQWSLEKLADSLEAIMRDEVKPIMDVLKERLGNSGQQASVATSMSAPPTGLDAAESEDVSATTSSTAPTVAPAESESPHYEPRPSKNEETLLQTQCEMKEMLEEVLVQLRELSERAAALSDTAAAAPTDKNIGSAEDHRVHGVKEEEGSSAEADTWKVNAKHAVNDEHFLQALRDVQRQHQVELLQALETMKEQLQVAQSPLPSPPQQPSSHAPLQSDDVTTTASTITVAPASAPSAVSEEVIKSAVTRVVEEVSLVIRQSIQKSVAEQLDSYCEVHRQHRSNSNSSDVSGLNGSDESKNSHGVLSLPVLPVTSFELDEILTRTVNFALREVSSEVEDHVRVAMEKALCNYTEPVSTAAATSLSDTGVNDSHSSSGNRLNENSNFMKKALEEMWEQVKAEAAEKEAVKLSQHSRQLHRLFRRQQHLRMTYNNNNTNNNSNSCSAAEAGLTIVAVEEAVRAAMHPYMAQLQATLIAATETREASSTSPSSSSPSKEE